MHHRGYRVVDAQRPFPNPGEQRLQAMAQRFDVGDADRSRGALQAVGPAEGFVEIVARALGLPDAVDQEPDLLGVLLMLRAKDLEQLLAAGAHSLYRSTAERNCCAIALTLKAACSSCCVPLAVCELAWPMSLTALEIWSRPICC